MRVSYACSPPVLSANGPETLEVLITFHAEGPRPSNGASGSEPFTGMAMRP